MNREQYALAPQNALVQQLEAMYVRLFGIPEVGLRLRSMHFRHALRRVPTHAFRILDAGSGIGAYSILLAQRYPHTNIVGWDIDSSLTTFATTLGNDLKLTNLEFVTRDITSDADDPETFDAIVCIDVLEHVDNFVSALVLFHRLLRPGGILFVHTPQPNQRRIFRRFAHWEHEGHVREGFAPSALANDLNNMGFRIIESRETFGYFGKLGWELNHATLSWNTSLAALAFPLALAIASIDLVVRARSGLGVFIVAAKREYQPSLTQA